MDADKITTKTTKLPSANLPRYYAVTEIQGETCIACHNGVQWEMDDTCNLVNEMLRNGLINPQALQGWIDRKNLPPH